MVSLGSVNVDNSNIIRPQSCCCQHYLVELECARRPALPSRKSEAGAPRGGHRVDRRNRPARLHPARGGPAVLIFENVMLYNMTGKLAAVAGAVDIDKAAIRRPGRDISLITYGGSLWKTLEAATALAAEGIEAEVVDLRSLRPLDDATIMTSVAKTRHAVIIDEGWRSGSLAAEVGLRIVEQAFWALDAPIGRVCSEEVPIPYPRHLENAAIPQTPKIVAAAKAALGRA